jgi:MraZ protein
MRYATLDKELVVTGSGECIEVWDRQAYETYHDDILDRIPDIAASLGDTT